jgi:excinuclease ABC subunit B
MRVMADEKVEYITEDGSKAPALDPIMMPRDELAKLIKNIEKEMKEAAKDLEFERAAQLRDQLIELRQLEVEKIGSR